MTLPEAVVCLVCLVCPKSVGHSCRCVRAPSLKGARHTTHVRGRFGEARHTWSGHTERLACSLRNPESKSERNHDAPADGSHVAIETTRTGRTKADCSRDVVSGRATGAGHDESPVEPSPRPRGNQRDNDNAESAAGCTPSSQTRNRGKLPGARSRLAELGPFEGVTSRRARRVIKHLAGSRRRGANPTPQARHGVAPYHSAYSGRCRVPITRPGTDSLALSNRVLVSARPLHVDFRFWRLLRRSEGGTQ